MENKIERRFIEWEAVEAVETRAENGQNQREIRGYAAVFDKFSQDLGGFREKIAPGAFRDALGAEVFAFWNHNSDIVLASTSNQGLTLTEDDRGLKFSMRMDSDVWSDYAFNKIQSKTVRGMSFGFRVPPGGAEWGYNSQKQLERTLKKIQPLIEVSPTPIPAYTQTSVSARSADYDCRSIADILKEGMGVLEIPKAEGRNLLKAAQAKLRLIGAC